MRIKWIEIKDDGGLISAANTLDCGLRQLQADQLVALVTVSKHLQICESCRNGVACGAMKSILLQIKKRFESHKVLLETIDKLNRINKWYKPPKDKPSVMHGLNKIMEFYGVKDK